MIDPDKEEAMYLDGAGTEPVNRDHRIRMQQGDYRVVAPKAQRPKKNGRVYINGELVVEKRGKDSLGQETWTVVTSFQASSDSSEDEALFTLLSNGGDQELPF